MKQRGRVLVKTGPPSRLSSILAYPASMEKALGFAKWIEKNWPKDASPFTNSRQPEHVQSRQICWYIMRDIWNMPYRYIIATFHRDHATIIHGLKKIRMDAPLVEKAKKIEDEFARAIKKR